ncbi:UDP-N-acetylglucosamine 2-epimerase (non-hydrolyzing) [Pelagibacteraceae bacterium]|nr:UDP-N-acetylglucosamine 2-epimerase (non-hydrolyzing) [Pelagibacteraceae bacterium]
MKNLKIMLVFGTRPEAIKMAPVFNALKAKPQKFELKICVTSQHRRMLDQVLKIFKIKPDIDLNIMKKNQCLTNLTALILKKMKKIFKKYKPDVVLVHGDTTTSLATSVAAFYHSIPVGHVEAGLRTYNLKAPFPEEFNRQITSKIAHWHFTPTILSKKNLLSEGINETAITVTGNTVIDALYWVLNQIDQNTVYKNNLIVKLKKILKFNFIKDQYILITAHRRENFGNGFLQICSALRQLAKNYPNVHFVYPVHLNPNVLIPVTKILGKIKNIHLIKPQEYVSFVFLMKHAYFILSDSGGIQEEAPSLGKPVLLMRDLTERPEGVKSGTTKLIGSNQSVIVKAVSKILDDKKYYKSISISKNPYGDGLASKRIVNVLSKFI